VRILVVTQYFSPEVTAASLRLEPISAGLAERGHDVEVICEVPNHPGGIVTRGYEGQFCVTRAVGGYRVHHVWVKASPSKRARARLAAYATFAASATLRGSALKGFDVVLASSPPLSVGVVGAVLAWRYRAPLVLDVRDLWPHIAVALGELRPGRVLALAERLERWLYRRAMAVTTPTDPFRRHIVGVGGQADNVEVIPNGTTRAWLDAGSAAPDRSVLGIDTGVFVTTYAGNLGLSQDLETAIEAVRLLGDQHRLLLLGDGTARTRLEEYARERAAGLVEFHEAVPPAEAARMMRASDALLVTLANDPELGRSVPVKIYDSCAVGRPLVAAIPGEARRLLVAAEAAVLVDPEDPEALASALESVRSDPARAQRVVENARIFAEANLRERGVERLNDLLENVAAEAQA
jgi:glycosyltransferase involved in cell wall biosynthesis